MIPQNDREAISLIIDGMIEQGCTPTIARDGENEDLKWEDAATVSEFLDWLTSCDESVMFVDLPKPDPESGLTSSYIYFVLGNEPIEVASDGGVAAYKYVDPIVEPWWA